MAEAIADAPRYYASPVLNAACPDEEKYRVAAELVERFKKDGYRVIELSGARVEFGDGWGLVRASSNLPQLVLRFEGRTPERLEQIQSLFRGMLAEYETVSQDWHSG
jgi:phosphomannomutase/phosphoglucomutase